MAKSIEVDINVNNNIEGSIAQLKALKRELKNTAVGTEEFKNLYNQIDDLEDKIKSAKNVSSDWIDSLEMAGGPIGMLGASLNKAKVATQSWGAALKATGIGLIVAAVGGLVAAFSESETSMKKLEPLFISLEKILGGIMKVFEPLLDAFIELAVNALPYITKGVGLFYSGLFGLFTLIKNVGIGAGKILKGIFTLDFGSISEGYEQLKGSWGEAVKDFEDTNKRFVSGTNEVTKTERKNAKERVAIRKTEKKEKDKIIDSELSRMREFQNEYENYLKKLADLEAQYNTEIEDLQANTDQKRLDLWYKRKKEEIDAITQDAAERKKLYALLDTERAIKQKEIDDKAKEDKSKNNSDELKDEKTLQKQRLEITKQTLGNMSALFEKSSTEGKAFAVAQALINTYQGITAELATKTATPFEFGIKLANIATTAAIGFKSVQDILSTEVGSSNISSTAPTATSTAAPSFNVVGTSGVNQLAQTLGAEQPPVKAYVVASDVTTQQALNRNIVTSASLG